MSEVNDNVTRLNPVARVIIQGLYDAESPLHLLLGMHFILKSIWQDVVNFWKSRIKRSEEINPSYVKQTLDVDVAFPEPTDININMMPFIMSKQFSKTKLPDYLKNYFKQVIFRCIWEQGEYGKIGYLTIHESYVDEGLSQRRPGIHTESPGVALWQGSCDDQKSTRFFWGGGRAYGRVLYGGIFMASTVENSCKVWDCHILRSREDEVVGEHGDIEHLREFLPSPGHIMAPNKLYWITDRTPHESLSLSKGTYRQFFRLVTSAVSAWYEDHSTRNPLGVVPDPQITKIIKGSKFVDRNKTIDRRSIYQRSHDSDDSDYTDSDNT